MESFIKLSEVDLSVLEPKSNDVNILISKLDEARFVVNMKEEEEPKSWWEAVNGSNG
jgi:transcription initiation factor IIE alpha subunit